MLYLRGAQSPDLPALMRFYRATETDTLPPPSLQTLVRSLDVGSLLIAQNASDGAILATAGYFDYIKTSDAHQVFELAGTRVTGAIGRLAPLSLQQILLAVRLFQIASTEGGDHPISVISSARHPKSIANLQALQMAEIAEMPAWLEYDTCSWTRQSERTNWRHFLATPASMRTALAILEQVDFYRGGYLCVGERRGPDGSSESSEVAISFALAIRWLLPAALSASKRGELTCNFLPLPPEWC